MDDIDDEALPPWMVNWGVQTLVPAGDLHPNYGGSPPTVQVNHGAPSSDGSEKEVNSVAIGARRRWTQMGPRSGLTASPQVGGHGRARPPQGHLDAPGVHGAPRDAGIRHP